MSALIFGILSSAFIFILFRLFPKFGVDTFQAIVFNYFTACACGFLLYGDQLSQQALDHLEWLPFSVVTGILFISLFLAIGISSQRNGVAMTSVAVKMSMAMTMGMMIIFYNESLSGLKVLGILLAVFGVLAMSWTQKQKAQADLLDSMQPASAAKPIIWLLVFLFFGSGVLDFLLNYVQNYQQEFLPSSLFSAVSFGFAGCLGMVFLVVGIIRKKRTFQWKNVLAGICLGIPNYFSIYLLLLSYSTTGWTDSTVLAITNVSIVLLTAFIGFMIFKENFTRLKLAGLISAIGAIVLLYLASLQLKS